MFVSTPEIAAISAYFVATIYNMNVCDRGAPFWKQILTNKVMGRTIIADNWLWIAETFLFGLIDYIFENRCRWNIPPPSPIINKKKKKVEKTKNKYNAAQIVYNVPLKVQIHM